MEKVVRLSHDQVALDFSSLWAVFTGCSGDCPSACCILVIQPALGREITLSVWVLGLQSTWLQLWSTWRPRFLSWLATRPGTIRRRGSFPGTCSWPSGRDVRCGIALADPHTSLHRNDEELNKLLAGVTIAQGGVLPNIQAVLLPKKSASSKEKA